MYLVVKSMENKQVILKNINMCNVLFIGSHTGEFIRFSSGFLSVREFIVTR